MVAVKKEEVTAYDANMLLHSVGRVLSQEDKDKFYDFCQETRMSEDPDWSRKLVEKVFEYLSG